MGLINKVFDKKAVPLLAGAFLLLLLAERKRSLRKRRQPVVKRVVTNIVLAIPSIALLRWFLLPVMVKLALSNKSFGISRWLKLNPAARVIVSFLLLDYGNYHWHVLNHKIPGLWRFHAVHHADVDMDVFTSIRFHFMEMIGSTAFRGFCVWFSGANAEDVLFYELCFEAATQFHHSNWKLPIRTEQALNKVLVTPVMHGIHHSQDAAERDSNYAVIFSFWDRLHHTLDYNAARWKVSVGLPSLSPDQTGSPSYVLAMPFRRGNV